MAQGEGDVEELEIYQSVSDAESQDTDIRQDLSWTEQVIGEVYG